jgi:hypothetical protein
MAISDGIISRDTTATTQTPRLPLPANNARPIFNWLRLLLRKILPAILVAAGSNLSVDVIVRK